MGGGRFKARTMNGETNPTSHRCTLAISSREYIKLFSDYSIISSTVTFKGFFNFRIFRE
jgi:hypothetical protein